MNQFLICANCNWEIIPMLLGSWLLGLLFWKIFFSSKNKKLVSQLSTDLEHSKIMIRKQERDLEAEKYKNVKLTVEIGNREKQIKSLEFKIEELNN